MAGVLASQEATVKNGRKYTMWLNHRPLHVLSTIYVPLALTVYDLAEEAVGDS